MRRLDDQIGLGYNRSAVKQVTCVRTGALAETLAVVLCGSSGACGSSPSAPAESDAAVVPDGAPVIDAAATVDAAIPLPDAFVPGYYGFEQHLEEAIALNTEREPLYYDATDGRTVGLSQLLITSERSLLNTAAEFDARGLEFQNEGIPIVAADFVPMTGAPAYGTPIAHNGSLSADARSAASAALDPLRIVDSAEFQEVCDLAYQALHDLEAIENTYDVHLAMTKHLLESPALAALHAITYAAVSDGRTAALSADLVSYQLELPLEQDLGLLVDAEANQYHMEGVGIIVNDVPHIPFAEEYEEAMGL